MRQHKRLIPAVLFPLITSAASAGYVSGVDTRVIGVSAYAAGNVAGDIVILVMQMTLPLGKSLPKSFTTAFWFKRKNTGSINLNTLSITP